MNRSVATGIVLLLLAGAASAGAENETSEAWEPGELRAAWSTTLIGQYTNVPSPEDDDAVGGWFDQYDFTPNKSSSFPFELGIRDGAFDLFRDDDTPVFQARLDSPTSNLGVSGSQVDQPFFNQRLDALTRLRGIDIDLFYRRIRTEQLRLFPDTQGPGLVFQDQTSPDDRFYRDRTGFSGEARLRPYQALDAAEARGSWFAPELSLRGGYDWRDGTQQLRIHRPPSNDWLGLGKDLDRSVAEAGAGVLVAPGGLLTLTFDFDYEQLRFDAPIITDGDLGYPPPQGTRTIGFAPNSNRSTGTIRLNSRLGDRAVIEGGLQISLLEQEADFTPDQVAAGLEDNSVTSYSANAALDVHLVDDLSFNGFFKFDRRNNNIQRDTSLFNSTNGSQVDPFMRHWQRFEAGGEFDIRLRRSDRLGLGVRYEDVSRDLEFAAFGNPRILPENSQIERDSRIITLYGRASGRPWRRLRVDAELGYRWAPKVGYATELDANLYGRLRASYVFAFPRPLMLSGYVRGGQGENEGFSMISGQGPSPGGAELQRSYRASNIVAGITASISPADRLNVYASFFYGNDDRDTSLDLSTLPRYWQDQISLDFANDGLNRFGNEQLNFILGSHLQWTERTDGGLSYAFTRAQALYDGSDPSAALDLIADNRSIDSDVHVLDFEVGHWVRDGLRIIAGYRYQNYSDNTPLVVSVASAVAPFDRSSHRHTVTAGVTLNSDLFARAQ